MMYLIKCRVMRSEIYIHLCVDERSRSRTHTPRSFSSGQASQFLHMLRWSWVWRPMTFIAALSAPLSSSQSSEWHTEHRALILCPTDQQIINIYTTHSFYDERSRKRHATNAPTNVQTNISNRVLRYIFLKVLRVKRGFWEQINLLQFVWRVVFVCVCVLYGLMYLFVVRRAISIVHTNECIFFFLMDEASSTSRCHREVENNLIVSAVCLVVGILPLASHIRSANTCRMRRPISVSVIM